MIHNYLRPRYRFSLTNHCRPTRLGCRGLGRGTNSLLLTRLTRWPWPLLRPSPTGWLTPMPWSIPLQMPVSSPLPILLIFHILLPSLLAMVLFFQSPPSTTQIFLVLFVFAMFLLLLTTFGTFYLFVNWLLTIPVLRSLTLSVCSWRILPLGVFSHGVTALAPIHPSPSWVHYIFGSLTCFDHYNFVHYLASLSWPSGSWCYVQVV